MAYQRRNALGKRPAAKDPPHPSPSDLEETERRTLLLLSRQSTLAIQNWVAAALPEPHGKASSLMIMALFLWCLLKATISIVSHSLLLEPHRSSYETSPQIGYPIPRMESSGSEGLPLGAQPFRQAGHH